jgi:hypothetical protein
MISGARHLPDRGSVPVEQETARTLEVPNIYTQAFTDGAKPVRCMLFLGSRRFSATRISHGLCKGLCADVVPIQISPCDSIYNTHGALH